MFASGTFIYKYDEMLTSAFQTQDIHYAYEIAFIYPNPFSDQLTIQVRIDNTTNTLIDILSMEGRLLKSVYAGRLNPGTHEFSLNSNELESISGNIYNVLLRTNEGFLAKQVVRN